MKQILILGGGLSGYYIARALEKHLTPDKGQVTLVDARSGCVYQPFLAEVAGASIEPRHVVVPFAMHLKKTRLIQAEVTGISVADRTVDVVDSVGLTSKIPFDILVVALGAVTRVLPIPGIAESAVGLKTVEEAVYLRDTLIRNVRTAASLPKGSAERRNLLTFVCVGGGFSGMEAFSELYGLARRLVRDDSRLDASELDFHVIEATDRVFPELAVGQSSKVIRHLEGLGAHIDLSTCVKSAEAGHVVTSSGAEYDPGLILWTAGVKAAPVLAQTDLPLERRGRVICGPDLRVRDADGKVVENVWALGDCSCVPDLTGHGLPDGSCAPTAQHSMRQSKVLIANLQATLGGTGQLAEYRHENAGMVAGLGAGYGAFCSGALGKGGSKIRFNGWLAWMAHRMYHGFAVPSAERRMRIWGDWTQTLVLRRDYTDLYETRNQRDAFERSAR